MPVDLVEADDSRVGEGGVQAAPTEGEQALQMDLDGDRAEGEAEQEAGGEAGVADETSRKSPGFSAKDDAGNDGHFLAAAAKHSALVGKPQWTAAQLEREPLLAAHVGSGERLMEMGKEPGTGGRSGRPVGAAGVEAEKWQMAAATAASMQQEPGGPGGPKNGGGNGGKGGGGGGVGGAGG